MAGGDRKSEEYQKSLMQKVAEPIEQTKKSIEIAAENGGR
jgi:hypothetical protein